MFFLLVAKFPNLANFFSGIGKETWKLNCDFQGFFLPFLKIKIIKLATSRHRHFLGHHLYQHFCKKATIHLGESLYNDIFDNPNFSYGEYIEKPLHDTLLNKNDHSMYSLLIKFVIFSLVLFWESLIKNSIWDIINYMGIWLTLF